MTDVLINWNYFLNWKIT